MHLQVLNLQPLSWCEIGGNWGRQRQKCSW
uniref:Uncharacterized protein n=1 Tax=Anguilla anguilla TaxID=7936 RepID=A0A0E9PLF4_ANGAN